MSSLRRVIKVDAYSGREVRITFECGHWDSRKSYIVGGRLRCIWCRYPELWDSLYNGEWPAAATALGVSPKEIKA